MQWIFVEEISIKEQGKTDQSKVDQRVKHISQRLGLGLG